MTIGYMANRSIREKLTALANIFTRHGAQACDLNRPCLFRCRSYGIGVAVGIGVVVAIGVVVGIGATENPGLGFVTGAGDMGRAAAGLAAVVVPAAGLTGAFVVVLG
jgi:hypothetical protein